MGQPESPQAEWDGKCRTCRKLMSRCMCFQGPEDEASLKANSTATEIDAAETRPLWNALRKMHRKSTAARLILQPPKSEAATREQRKRSEALPPLAGANRHHHRRQTDARPPTARRASREPAVEPSPERQSHSRRDRLQRAGITCSSPNMKADSGVMRSVRSASSMDQHSRPKENFIYDPRNSDEDTDETVWEL